MFKYHDLLPSTYLPNSALGSSGILLKYEFPFYSPRNWNRVTGVDIMETGRSVDAFPTVCGFSTVLYIRGFFPAREKLYEEFLKYPLMDDIMISPFLSKNNIDRYVVPPRGVNQIS